MWEFLRCSRGLACTVLLLGISGCHDGGGSGDIVTNLKIEDASGASVDDFASGQEIHLVLSVQNTSDTVQSYAVSQCGPDTIILVADADSGDLVHVASAPSVVCPRTGTQTVTLQPGQKINTTFMWNQMDETGTHLVAPGRYLAGGGTLCLGSPGCEAAKPSASDARSPFISGPMTFTIDP